jgi:hypothetical protein
MTTNPQPEVNTPFDSNGQSYPAIRIKWLWNLQVPDALTHTAGPFLADTKVVRVTPSFGLYFTVVLRGPAGTTGGMIVGNGVFQDFYVRPGDSVDVVGVVGAAAGKWASIIELA